MPAVHYYGKKTNFLGKTLFEILANLRNFGINRMIVKQEELLLNPGQRCYYIVKKVEPIMDEKLEQGAIYAEQVFRGARVPGLVYIEEETWHTDWQLIPKTEEINYLVPPEQLVEHGHPSTITVLPRWMEVPPLMDIYMRRHYSLRNNSTAAPVKLDKQPMNIRMHYEFNRLNKPHMLFRTAKEGEEFSVNSNQPIKSLLMPQFRPQVKTNQQKTAN